MGETIVVTGGSGFIGSEVAFQLHQKDCEIITVDIVRPSFSFGAFLKHDLRKPLSLTKLPKISALIHLAAHIGNAAYGRAHPAAMLSDNALIDLHAIQAAKDLGVKRFIYISSSLVYEQSKTFPFREHVADDLPAPQLPYSFEKVFGERLCKAFGEEYGLQYSICRLFNAYGINSLGNPDNHKHVIVELIDKVLTQYPVEVLGSGRQKRNFTHVKDIAAGIISVLESTAAVNETFNIGNSHEYSVADIVRLLWKLTDQKKQLKIVRMPIPKSDLNRNYPNIKKIQQFTGWKAAIPMEKGLKEMISYQRSH